MREDTSSENDIEQYTFDESPQGTLEESLAGLYTNDSIWNKKKKYIESRPKNWLTRFTKEYIPIAPPILPKVELKEANYQLVSLTEPEKPRIYRMDELHSFNDPSLQSNLCVVCWKLVIIGSTRVKCVHCPVVVHRYCVANISHFFVPLNGTESNLSTLIEDPPTPKNHAPTLTSHLVPNYLLIPPPLKIQSDSQTDAVDTVNSLSPIQSNLPSLKTTTAFRRERTSKPKTRIPVSSPASSVRRGHREDHLPQISASPKKVKIVDPKQDDSTREVRWTCPFCIHEVNVGNDFCSRKYTRLLSLHRAKKAIIQIQSVFRMFPKRAKFLRMCEACRTIQRFHRSRNFRRALIRERTNQRRAVRIRIHELTLYLTDSEELTTPVLESAPRVFGQFGANMFPRNLSETPPLSMKHLQDGSIAALVNSADRRLQQGSTGLSKKMVMIELIRASTVGAGHHQLQMPVKDFNGFPFPPKSLFLTVTATRLESGLVNQLYRVDVPMRDFATDKEKLYSESGRILESSRSQTSSPSRPATVDREHIAYYEVIEEVSGLLEGDSTVVPSVFKMKIYPPKPMILFPALPANVRISFTVSEVVEWPRAKFLGQCSVQGDNWLIWRQIATISQGLSAVSNEDLPRPDHHSRLQINLWNTTSVESESESTTSVNISPKKVSKLKHKPPAQCIGGRVFWSLIPSSFISAIAGPLFFLPQASLTAAKKRSWCVVLDGCLIIYSHITDIRTKEVIELAHCYVYMLEGQVMKIYRSKLEGPLRGMDQTWFCFCAVPHLREEWFKIIKENCLNSKKKR